MKFDCHLLFLDDLLNGIRVHEVLWWDVRELRLIIGATARELSVVEHQGDTSHKVPAIFKPHNGW